MSNKIVIYDLDLNVSTGQPNIHDLINSREEYIARFSSMRESHSPEEYREAIARACRDYKPLVILLKALLTKWADDTLPSDRINLDPLWVQGNNLLRDTEWIHVEVENLSVEEWREAVAEGMTFVSYKEWSTK